MKTKQVVQVPEDLSGFPEEKLKVRHLAMEKLKGMTDSYGNKKFHNKCALQHISEMVKLVFQIDSLDKLKA